jgi:hypothetical protein
MAQQSLTTLARERVLKFVVARERLQRKGQDQNKIHPTNRSLAGHTVNERTSLAIARPPAPEFVTSLPQLAVSLFSGEPAKTSPEEDHRVT